MEVSTLVPDASYIVSHLFQYQTCETDLLGNDPLGSGWAVCTVIRLDHVEDIIRRVGNEFSRGI
jgi:hypothetical protein